MKKIIFIFYFFFKFLVLTINPSYGFIGFSLNCDDTVSVAITAQQTCQDNDTLTVTSAGSINLS
tara:strand:+ start:575 stop:766 length:192 start_codon:yes stop_codon:yes gene_type:complete